MNELLEKSDTHQILCDTTQPYGGSVMTIETVNPATSKIIKNLYRNVR